MPAFSESSYDNLTTKVHPDLIRLFSVVIQSFDCTILNGIRTLVEQQADVAAHLSETLNSKHLPQADGCSHAVDAAPYPQRWNDPNWFKNQIFFAGYVMGVANQLGIPITWGGDWKDDNDPEHNGFQDLDHFQRRD